MAVNIQNGHKVYQHFSYQGRPKHTRVGIFCTKMSHLATLVGWLGKVSVLNGRFFQEEEKSERLLTLTTLDLGPRVK
jgi:hypothetical protein